jgi:hypothetical protein
MKGGRKPNKWNLFVQKIYNEGKAKNSNYDFKQALSDASERKSEMNSGNINTTEIKSKKNYKKISRKLKSNRKSSKSRKSKKINNKLKKKTKKNH